jgi:hypothetical protein
MAKTPATRRARRRARSCTRPSTGHGGRRAGAGRRPLDETSPTVKLHLVLTQSLADDLEELRHLRGDDSLSQTARGIILEAHAEARMRTR